MRAIERTQFRTKSAENDLKPTDFLKRNFYFETGEVSHFVVRNSLRAYKYCKICQHDCVFVLFSYAIVNVQC